MNRIFFIIIAIAFAIAMRIDQQTGISPMAPAVEVDTLSVLTDYEIAVWLCKSEESLRLTAYKDVSRYSIGWGTESFKGEKITRLEANMRYAAAFKERFNFVQRRYPKLDRWTALVYTNTYYNVGNAGPSLHKALKQGDKEKIAKLILLYNKADGKVLPGLKKRRELESRLLLANNVDKQEIGEILRKKVSDI